MEAHAHSNGLLIASIRRHIVLAGVAAVLLVGGIGGWAAYMEISGAVVAAGRLVADTHTKPIQHREGGIVSEILVRDGDSVKTDELLLRLDDTVTRANLAAVAEQLAELRARRARLAAERDGVAEIAFVADVGISQPKSAALHARQANLLAARRKSLDEQRRQLQDQIDQFGRQLEGLAAQRSANEREIDLIGDELAGLLILLEQQLVPKNRVIALQRDQARLQGASGDLTAQAARVEEAISERKSRIIQLEEERRAEILQDLQIVTMEIVELDQQRVAAEDQLSRAEIRAPHDGTVYELGVFGEGAVVAPGETLMQIVPKGDLLVVRAEVRPVDIDQIRAGQEARVRLPSFDQRLTLELGAQVLTVSPDVSEDKQSGQFHYSAVLAIPEGQLRKLNGQAIIPGMPVEVFIETDDRTILSYLLKPLRDQIVHSMRES